MIQNTMLRLMYRFDDQAHRQTSSLTVADCEALESEGRPVPISGDATTKWINYDVGEA